MAIFIRIQAVLNDGENDFLKTLYLNVNHIVRFDLTTANIFDRSTECYVLYLSNQEQWFVDEENISLVFEKLGISFYPDKSRISFKELEDEYWEEIRSIVLE